MFEFLSGKKTYLVAIIGGIFAAVQWYGFHIPNEVYVLLSALGLGSLRAGVEKSKQ